MAPTLLNKSGIRLSQSFESSETEESEGDTKSLQYLGEWTPLSGVGVAVREVF
jgi:hypothetical protein